VLVITPAIQSVLNAAARLVFSARSLDHTHNATSPGTSLAEDHKAHSVPFVCPCLPLFARYSVVPPQYLAETLHLTSDTEACRRLQSGSTSTLFVPATRRSSLGDRAFPVAAARLWNTLLVSLRTVSSYLT